jgi:Fe-S-cluster containining protein
VITKEDLVLALEIATPLFEKLQSLYQQLPDTRCNCEQPGVCCRFLPEMTTLEALQWVKVLRDLPDDELTEKLRAFVEFYFSNPARLTGCPFLNDGGCSIYKYRTFGCRAYGLWSQELGKVRTAESRNQKKELGAMWKRFGVDLPASVVEFEIDYCDKVDMVSGKDVTDAGLMDVLQQIYDLDQPLKELQAKFENEYHSDFSLLITALALGMKKAILEKFAVIKEIIQKDSEDRLKKTLEKISPQVLR